MARSREIRPNLFIIGAAKAGTTSLHDYLGGHPQIFMSNPKEPGFFTPTVGYYPTDVEWYLSLFREAGDARWVGESSTHYTKLPTHTGAPERIADFCDSPRFIYLMRDPIDRIISQWWHGVRQEGQQRVWHRSMATAVNKEVEFTAFSDYAMQLQPYFETFGRDRVLVLTFEELVAEPDRVLREVFTWLGVDPVLAPGRLEKRNARPETILVPRGLGLLQSFRRSRLWEGIAPLFPKRLRTFAHGLSRRPVSPGDVEVGEVVELLRPGQRAKVEELSRLLGREFPLWTTTLGGAADKGGEGPARPLARKESA